MKITNKSILTGKTTTLEINVTQTQLDLWLTGKHLIQNVMPNLTPDEREFIMTGITHDEWETLKSEDD